jgi:Flp pilus assembly protein TadD
VYEELFKGHKEGAWSEYRSATNLDNPRVEALMNLTYYSMQEGKREDAAKELEQASLLLTALLSVDV